MKKVLYLLLFTLLIGLTSCNSCKKNDIEINIEKDLYEIEVGQEVTINVDLSGDAELVYESSNDDIVTFINGKIKGISHGETTIKVYAKDNSEHFDTATVKVKQPVSLGCSFDYEEVMYKNFEQVINYTLETNVSGISVAFSSSDENTLKVDQQGKVTPCGIGSAVVIVTVSYNNQNKEYELPIEIINKESTISYNLNEVEVKESLPLSYIEGNELVLPSISADGFQFDGWYLNDQLVTKIDKNVTGNITLTAKWTKLDVYYNLTFNLNGGSTEEDLPEQYKEGEEYILPIPTKVGYDFVGWYNGAKKITKISKDSKGDLKIIARWSKIPVYYTLTFDLDGGVSEEELPTTYEEGKELALPTPTKNGYDFIGWYDTNDNKVVKITKETTGDLSLKAKWEIANQSNYTVTFELNGGNWNYTSRAEMAADFYKDFSTYGDSKATSADNILGDIYKYRTAIVDFYNNTEMYNKWIWICDYFTANANGYGLKVQNERVIVHTANDGEYWMQGVVALMEGLDYSNVDNVKINCINDDFWSYLTAKINNTATNLNGNYELPIPKKPYYKFEGWYLDKDFSQSAVTSVYYGTTVYAKWVEETPVESVTILNKIESINCFENYQLTISVLPEDAVNKKVRFESSNPEVASINENGLITALSHGTVTIKVISTSPTALSDEFELTIVVPAHFNISYETNSYVEIDDSIILNAIYVDGQLVEHAVSWESLNPDCAVVDANGKVTGINKGNVVIRAKYTDEIYQDFNVTVLPSELSDVLKYVINNHESNVFTRYDLNIGSTYDKDIIGSINKLLFNEELVLDYTYNQTSNNKYGSDLESRKMTSIEFITVHYTGNMREGANAKANAEWFASPLSENETSIHYVTGNDGIYKCLDEPYKAAHAGDSSSVNQVGEFYWRETPVLVLDTDPKFADVTITKDATFAINGRDTGIKVPVETKYSRGYVTDSKWLNKFDIAVKAVDGKYYIGNTWWCYTQVSEGRICSNGGNNNSIGIESCVNEGSDLWYTWQKTAMLVADIMIRNNLDITRVKPHHFYSAKNCPQPMIENELEIWWEFIALVEAEYAKMTTYKNYTFKMNSDSDVINEHGRITDQPLHSQVITYQVVISDGTSEEVITLSSIVEGKYSK